MRKRRTTPLNDGKGDIDAIVVPLVPVEVLDGSCSLKGIRHEDKAASASHMVEGGQDHGVLHRAKLSEELLKLIGGSIQRKIENVEVALSAFSTSSHCQ